MSETDTPVDTPAEAAPPAAPRFTPDWQPLPLRARRLFVLGNVFGLGLLALGLLIPIGLLLRDTWLAVPLALAALALLPTWGAWLAYRQFECTRWRLDGDGYALRRGRLWQQETFVPRSRVQHIDLQRGPIERRFGLSTLVIHTAGTRQNAVATAGLDAAELAFDHVGDTELSHRGDAVGGLGIGHFAEVVRRARPEDVVAKLRLAHRSHQLAQDDRLERFGRLAQPAVAATGGCGGRDGRRKGDGCRHMITSSAVSAPAWLSASRMATRSPGGTPMRLIASTSSESEAVGLTSITGR